jgi:ABC-type transporter Mla subunit MlaD
LPLRLTVTLCAAALVLAAAVGVLAWPRIVRAHVVAVLPSEACVTAGIPVRYVGLTVGHVDRVERAQSGATVVTLALTRRDLPLTSADRARETADGAAVEIVRAPAPAPALDSHRDTLRGTPRAPAEGALRQLEAMGFQLSSSCRR